ncbi:MAG: glycosyltransferase family 39 protein [Gemmatimonadaceae bacterium]
MSSKTSREASFVVLALVAVAIVARVIGLNDGLWVDEVYSLVRSFREPVGKILTEYWGDNHHPLYALLAHASRAAFGEAPWTIRLPAMMFGVASVPLLLLLGERVMPRREAILAALLLAVSYYHVWFSQNARGYSAIAFFTLATLWALLRGVEGGRSSSFIAYGVLAGLGAYTHLTMIFVVVGHAVAMAIWLLTTASPAHLGRLVRQSVLAFGLGALSTVVLYAPMLKGVIDFFLHRPSQLKGVSTPAWALLETIRVLLIGIGAGGVVIATIVLAVGAAVAISGFVSLWRSHRLFALAFVLPIVVTLVGAGGTRGTLYPRFFFFAIGPAILILVRGAFVACGWFGRRLHRATLGPQLAVGGMSMAIALSALSLGANYRYPKQDFKGAMQYVLSERRTGDQVVTAGIPSNPLNTLYLQPWPDLATRASLDSVRKTARTWVVWTFPRYLERNAPEIAQVLQQECPHPRAFHGTVGGGDIMVCALNPQ